MKKRMNKLTAMLVTLVLMVSLMPAALAVEQGTVDPATDRGEITVTLKYGETPVSGINVALYGIALGKVEDNNLYFELLDAYKPAEGSGEAAVNLNGLTAEQTAAATEKLAQKLSQMTAEQKETLRVGTYVTDEAGQVKFEDLPVGVYLVVQSVSNSYTFSPTLLYLPYTNKEGVAWEFAVTANPKVSYSGGGGGGGTTPEPDPEDPPPIIIPDEDPPLAELPEGPELEDILDEEPPLALLPQTGLLQWPIPVMAAAGLMLIALGLMSEKKNKAKSN